LKATARSDSWRDVLRGVCVCVRDCERVLFVSRWFGLLLFLGGCSSRISGPSPIVTSLIMHSLSSSSVNVRWRRRFSGRMQVCALLLAILVACVCLYASLPCTAAGDMHGSSMEAEFADHALHHQLAMIEEQAENRADAALADANASHEQADALIESDADADADLDAESDAELDEESMTDHDPSFTSFIELSTEVDGDDQSHLENLLALQDKYTAPAAKAPSAVPEYAPANEVLSSPIDDLPSPSSSSSSSSSSSFSYSPASLMETDNVNSHSDSESSSLEGGIGMRVGASAEVDAANAAGVDMSLASQMEAQLEQLAQAQQSEAAKREEATRAEQTKNLLSFFWGNTPRKVWHENKDWDHQKHPVQTPTSSHSNTKDFLAPDEEHLEQLKKQVEAKKQQQHPDSFVQVEHHANVVAAKNETKTNAEAAPAAPAAPPAPKPPAPALHPASIGKKEVFWLSIGAKRFTWEGRAGSSYAFNNVADARAACKRVGAELATSAQLNHAFLSGAEWCACGLTNDGTSGFPQQKKVAGCGKGRGTNEICKAGGATCYGFKPKQSDVKQLGKDALVAPFKPGQWNEDPFAPLNEACLHAAPWDTKTCLQPAWALAGCTSRGTRYPSSEASTVLWNNMASWSEVIADMRRIAGNDVAGGSTSMQCKGAREVYFLSKGPKRFIWNGQAGDGYPYNNVKAAQAACESVGATLATKSQLHEAWRDGAEWCMCGAVADSSRWMFPMHHSIKGCGSKKGIVAACAAGGATCYGVKPSEGSPAAEGVSPFRPGQWHQNAWTPLSAKCAHEPPYSLEECLQPAWKLAGCTTLGRDYPALASSSLVKQWNSMSWDAVRGDMLSRARSNPASCLTKFAELDASCNHAPPYDVKRCLQPALVLAGCDSTGYIWPSAKTAKSNAKSKKHSTNPMHATTLWWNQQRWPVVIRDMQGWAQADLIQHRESHRGGCRGLKEVFWFSGSALAQYEFTSADEAANACNSIGAELATPEQVASAQEAGAEWCAAGFTTDGLARFPVQKPRRGCAHAAGVATWNNVTKAGANCYGFKPSVLEVRGVLPFNPRLRFSQVREWKVTPLNECSRQCGSGEQKRRVRCINPLTGERRPDHTCLTLGPKPPRVAKCNTHPCPYDWEKGSWGDCSVTCGPKGGVQKRKVRCIQSTSGSEYPDSYCLKLGEEKPRMERKCNNHPCIAYKWTMGGWANCTHECGTGRQSRTVLCVGSDKKVHEDERCVLSGQPKPHTEQQCNSHKCPVWTWRKDAWSECSLSCNGGKQSREVFCVDELGNKADSESRCLSGPHSKAGPKPKTVRPCNTQQCDLFQWWRGSWSNCTHICGGGQSSRVVECRNSQNKTVDHAACAAQSPQPRTSKSCNAIACSNFNWHAQSWSDCSASCGGTGYQTREVSCVGSDHTLAKDVQCINAGPKKATKQTCNTQLCVTLSWVLKSSVHGNTTTVASKNSNTTAQLVPVLGDEGWSKCSRQCGGGYQTREVVCRASDGTLRDAAACQQVLGFDAKTRRTCNTQPCTSFSFKPTKWSTCSLSCGGGISTREVPCMGSDEREYPASRCLAGGLREPTKQQPCNTQKCEAFTWHVGTYSTCSKICGGGRQVREVVCMGTSGKKYEDKYCALIGDKPASKRACATEPCVDMHWSLSDWDGCSASCGGGHMMRSVTCLGTDKKTYSDQDCMDSLAKRNSSLPSSELMKPPTKIACNTQPCRSYYWLSGPWQKCSASCNGGLQTRDVHCMSSDGERQADSLCTPLATKPSTSQTCALEKCPSYQLQVGRWDDCSRSCGGGTQNRTIVCVSSRGVRFSIDEMGDRCASPPAQQRLCNTEPCASEVEQGWKVGAWKECDERCGGGVQSRLVTCISQADPTCSTFGPKPSEQRACNTAPCTVYEWKSGEWDECSRSCGEDGVQRREVTCVGSDGSRHNNESLCKSAGPKPDTTKPCKQSACVSASWKASEWKPCSKACGGGVSTRDVVCQGSDGMKRTDDVCANQGPKPSNSRPCNTEACEKHAFRIGDWEECSRSCGGGLQKREVACLSSTTHQSVELKKCLTVRGMYPPPSARRCNTEPCLSFFWHVGAFGKCSSQCNGGVRTRAVTCMSSAGSSAKEELCQAYAGSKPSTQESCNVQPCGTFAWTPEPTWESCSVSCDKGAQTRPVHCVGPDGNRWPSSICANAALGLGAKPSPPTQICATQSCGVVMWEVAPWSNCSAKCDGGMQVRTVTCRKNDGTAVDDAFCKRHEDKPRDERPCNTQPCKKYKWQVSEFDDCSVSCGGGVQTREVHCVDNFGSRVSSGRCLRRGLTRPPVSQRCNSQACGSASSWLIDPWQPCSKECNGGHRIRAVRCRPGNNSTDHACHSILPMPLTTEACNTQPCQTWRWEPSKWSRCSHSCEDVVMPANNGSVVASSPTPSPESIQTRDIRCRSSSGALSSIKRCLAELGESTMPASTRPCKVTKACPRYRWSFGKWSRCNKRCNQGQQKREVYCANEHGAKVDKKYCVFAGSQPHSTRKCNTHPCVRDYRWKHSEWSDCTQACASAASQAGKSTRSVTCVDIHDRPVISQACEITVGPKPAESKVCGTTPCKSYQWRLSEWSKCSSWCDGGHQERQVTCVDHAGKTAKDAYCAFTSGPKAATKRACNKVPCVSGTWKTGKSWSECSRSCGGGTRTRQVACVASDGGVLPDEACMESGPRPRSSASCNKHQCTSAAWFIGSWSACSKHCGSGTQHREVSCVSSDGLVTSDVNCAYAGKKAAKERACNTVPCENYAWKYSLWSDCTVSCGGGEQTRTATCFNTLSGRHAATQLKCAHQKQKALKRACNTHKCVTVAWKMEPWSTCSASCGGGIKQRNVTCVASDGKSAPDAACLLLTAKPDTQRVCASQPCSALQLYRWKVGSYGACSQKCTRKNGTPGVQLRKVHCVSSRTGEKVADTSCLAKKPAGSRWCNTQSCDAAMAALEMGAAGVPDASNADMDDSADLSSQLALVEQAEAEAEAEAESASADSSSSQTSEAAQRLAEAKRKASELRAKLAEARAEEARQQKLREKRQAKRKAAAAASSSPSSSPSSSSSSKKSSADRAPLASAARKAVAVAKAARQNAQQVKENAERINAPAIDPARARAAGLHFDVEGKPILARLEFDTNGRVVAQHELDHATKIYLGIALPGSQPDDAQVEQAAANQARPMSAVNAIRHLPVVPQTKLKPTVDEYGDMEEE